ncbi:DnaA N-terminal domain-containing protein [Roseovarius nanhaiticus]|uniref:DnaA N-terminal domain-containing protein n=1 Tax=Roseovarius nanhaiticus TaxID=573024 RepID=UPI00249005E3|nr:DnaA N-terminal domain-containing protein [Roseovarius nanhaiticus]
MQIRKPVGPMASARKYDLLTALGAFALARGKTEQRMTLRLMTLVTARYNWARDELAVGQRDIARLWSVDERTVKREMARLRGCGWLRVTRQGARGRVTQYSLDIGRILEDTQDQWPAIGPDFVHRLSGSDPAAPSNVVPLRLPEGGAVPPPDLSGGTEWALAQGVLHGENPATYKTWFAGLARLRRDGARLVLTAPSRFHGSYVQTHLSGALLAACRAVDAGIDEVVVTC